MVRCGYFSGSQDPAKWISSPAAGREPMGVCTRGFTPKGSTPMLCASGQSRSYWGTISSAVVRMWSAAWARERNSS
ncbi:hypothetical protein GCM10010467_14860 [Actinocorallia glomerata]|uniref:Uncharacterized protein n=1 Tax=Actinocorallia glomerata TaxID=46203 RepID=A0ABP6PQ06_9ACTN